MTTALQRGPAPERSGAVVLLVDDQELVRRGLRLLLEACLHHDVIEAGSGEAAVEIASESDVDVMLLDVQMPERDGLWVLQELARRGAEFPVVMLSAFDGGDAVRGSLDAGASGFLLKDSSLHQMSEAIDAALNRRGVYLHPIAAQHMLTDRTADFGERLTDRETQVLRLLTVGATNDEIASALFVTEKTVKTHLSAIFRKLDVSNRTQAAMKAMRDGLIST